MSATPLLSVFIRTYNGERFVREAVESALDNGFSDFEVVVVDDGSSDATMKIVESFRHPALRPVRNPQNLGFIGALNAGIGLARGRHVAVLDQDDIALPGRFARQVELLECADGPDIVGSAVDRFGAEEGAYYYPASDAEIKSYLLVDAAFALPAVSMRLAPFRDGRLYFREEAGPAGDFALWVDAMFCDLKLSNLPEVLIRYRRHAASASVVKNRLMNDMAHVQRLRVIDDFFPQLPPAVREPFANALSRRVSKGGQAWLDAVYAMAHAASLVGGVRRTEPALLLGMLEQVLVHMIALALRDGIISHDTLESMTEANAHFEAWRAANNGRLDARLMALPAP